MKLRYYQKEAFRSTVNYIRKNPGKHPIIQLPTGAGKTLVISSICDYLVKRKKKVLVVSHVKEILEQNHASISKFIGYDVGLNSSMLGRREFKDITVAGIQSIYRSDEVKKYDVIIIDEAHMIPDDPTTMYQRMISNASATCVGLTATPYRLGSGYIYGQSAMFDDLVCNYGTADKFNQLITDGYLCKLTTKRTKLEMDTSGINLIGGDFNEKQLSAKFDRESVTNEAIKEIIAAGQNRKKWLIFAIDIDHAAHIAEILIRNGIPTALVHSQMHKHGFDRTKTIKGFKDGKYRCVVNVNILTTGFDDPGIDLICCLRPTQSPTLHVQSLGRGSRVEDGKSDCLVLDFAGNTARLGPINDPLVVIKRKGKEGEGDPITKTCPDCQSILPPAIRICPDCGHKFKFEHGLSPTATNYDIIDDGKAHWVSVDKVGYALNKNFGSPTSVKVTYTCGNKNVNEWVCIEHKGFAKHKADHWVKFRGGDKCNTAEDLIRQSEALSSPSKILVQKKNKYFVISDARF